MNSALSWFLNTVSSCVSGLNFSLTIGSYTFGLLDFLVASFLVGVIVRNFVHIAR